jgi:site-specific recombinase XerD
MEQKHTFAISFYQRVDKIDTEKTAPIFMRVTVNGERADISINRRIHIERWEDGKVKGTSTEAKNLNQYLDSLKTKIYEIQRYYIDRNELVSAGKVKNRYLGKDIKTKTLVEVFEYHNKQMYELIGKDFSLATHQRYLTTLKHVKEFLQKIYKCSDMYLSELKYEFITNFEHYLKTDRDCSHNSTLKYLRNFRKIINLALKNEWIEKDPFLKFTCRFEEIERGYLSPKELNALENKKILIPRLDIVRDTFVFSCYTGLAYAEVAKLSKEHLMIGIDGEKWIHIIRTKTEKKSIIPLLPKALQIIEKYKNYPKSETKVNILPILSNQKMNAYLKELAGICKIQKDLTFHLARHTFATTVTLTNGVPIESVSAMLGHKNIRTTQIYSKVVEQKVGNDMAELRRKLSEPRNKKRVNTNAKNGI